MVIGVTGKYAAGKDEVSRLLAARGYREINVDALGHRALEELKTGVVRLFGDPVISPDGSVDRPALGRIVFARPDRLKRLEALIHPRLRKLVREEVGRSGGRCVVNAAILFPLGLAELCRLVIVVRAPFCTRFRRARARDGLTLGAFFARHRVQKKILPKNIRVQADIESIWNTRNKTYLKDRIDAILRRYAPHGTGTGPPSM